MKGFYAVCLISIAVQKMKISFKLNNKNVEIEVDPTITLLEVLRKTFKLTGTKSGCGQGDCGACTVIMDGQAVNSCLILAGQIQSKSILTIEGLSSKRDGLFSALQKAFVSNGAVQCGFCTPGMIISAYSLLRQNHTSSREDIKKGIAGNLCRCTGYHKIIQAIEKAAFKN